MFKLYRGEETMNVPVLLIQLDDFLRETLKLNIPEFCAMVNRIVKAFA